MKPIEDKLELTQSKEIRRIESPYTDFPPLPPRVPQPDYLTQDQSRYSQDQRSQAFYSACPAGNLLQVSDYIDNAQPSHADRQYGLEKATHAFQIGIVRYLMHDQDAKIHTRIFQIHKNHSQRVQRLFSNPSIVNIYLWEETRGWPKANVRLMAADIFASGCFSAGTKHYLDSNFYAEPTGPMARYKPYSQTAIPNCSPCWKPCSTTGGIPTRSCFGTSPGGGASSYAMRTEYEHIKASN